MNIIAIIPARMGSSRFPGKPLEPIHGVPMVGHVYQRTNMSKTLNKTYVATCDKAIMDYMAKIGGPAVMTADTHERCTDRCAEAMLAIEKKTGEQVDIVVMVQGDEPLVTPEMIDASLEPLLDNEEISVVNLMAEMQSEEEFRDPNEVKVVAAPNGKALYFSREPIPSRAKWDRDIPRLKQVCIIPFRRDYLLRFNELPETPLERIESVDMLRILEHGEDVHMVMTNSVTQSVDTPSDLTRAEELMKEDSLMNQYLESTKG